MWFSSTNATRYEWVEGTSKVPSLQWFRVPSTYPVTVEDDDRVGSGQVDPQTPCPSAQQEQEHLGIGGESLHLGANRIPITLHNTLWS